MQRQKLAHYLASACLLASPLTALGSFFREAENHTLPNPYTAATGNRWQTLTDAQASGGSYIGWPQGAFDRSQTDSGAPAGDDPQALFAFTLSSTTNVGVWIRFISPSQGDDSVYYTLNTSDWTQFNSVKTAAWTWIKVVQYNSLAAGTHTFRLRPREDGFLVDAVYFSTDGSEPPTVFDSLTVGAETYDTGVAISPWSLSTGGSSEGSGFMTYSGTGQTTAAPAASSDGQLRYNFFVEETGSADIWARVRLPAAADDLFYFKWNNEAWQTQTGWISANWSWRKLATVSISSPGFQTLKIAAGEDGVSIDSIFIARNGAWPGLGRAFIIEAEDYTNTTNFSPLEKRLDDVDASVGAHITWHQTGADATNSDTAATGRATYSITHGFTDENLVLSARLKLPSASDNSFFYRVQGLDTAWQTFEATATDPGAWQWHTLRTYTAVAAGTYTLEIVRRENGARIDKFHVSADGSAPVDTVGRRPANALTAYYVSPHGNDSNPGTADLPWRTPRHAAANLPPGATVYIRGGTYPITDGVVVANTGSEDSPLIFAGYPGERPVFEATNLNYASYPEVVLVKNKAWVVVDNIHVVNSPQQGIVLAASSYSTIQNCSTTRTGMSGIAVWGDFGTQSPCRYVKVLNNRVFYPNQKLLDPTLAINPTTGVPDKADHEGITIGRAEHFQVAYNEVAYGGKEGIDSKGPNRYGQIHNNVVHHHLNAPYTAGIYLDAWTSEQFEIDVFDNVVYNCGKGVSVDSEDGQPIYNIRIFRNLVYNNSEYGFTVGHSSSNAGAANADYTRNVKFYNNTAVNNGNGILVNDNQKSGTYIVTDIDIRNNLFVNNRSVEMNIPGSLSGQNITLGYNQAWDADVTGATAIDADFGKRESNDLWADPLFADVASNNYNLTASSPGRNTGDPATTYNDADGTRSDRGALYFTTTLPTAASAPSPANAASNTALAPSLSWTGHSLARSHKLYFGTSSTLTAANFVRDLPAATTSYAIGTLRPGVTYYWRIDSLGIAGVRTGTTWSFTTGSTGLPGTAVLPSPANGATGVATTTNRLSWTPVVEANDYLVYFGTSSTLGAADLKSIQAGVAFNPGALAAGTTYHWRVDTRNASGTTTGPSWSFTTAGSGNPSAASAPSPASAATGVWLHPLLRWAASAGATSYNVYLGTSSTLGSGQLVGSPTINEFSPALLTASTTYYWRVDAVNANGTTAGPVWSFTTGAATFTDDFNDGNSTGWTVSSGTWSVQSGRLRQTGNVANDLIFLNNTSALAWTNYVVYAVLNSADDDVVSLVFRYKDADNYYRLSLSAQAGDTFTRLEKRVNGVGSILNGVPTGYTKNANFEVEAWVVGDQITIYVNGVNPFGLSVEDPDLASGSIGFHADFNSSGFFDNVVVRTLSEAPSAPRTITASTGSRLGEVNIQWLHQDDLESGFRLQRRTTGSTTWTLVSETIKANQSLFTDTGLVDGASYEYRIQAFNSIGSSGWATSSSVSTRAAATSAPTISGQPVGGTRKVGESFTFTVTASGVPEPTFQWRKNGTAISGATASTYTINSLVAGDAGTYTVYIQNSAGNVTSNNAVLVVQTPPAITTQPVSVTVTEGSQASFTVAASGDPAPTFQWFKGTTAIPSATSATFTLTAAAESDEGSYSVVATNAAGTATSNTVTLTVNPPTQTQDPIVIENTDTRVSYSSTNWFVVTNITGSSGGSFRSIGNLANENATVTPGLAGTYDIEVYQPAWSRSSTGVTFTVNHASGSSPFTVNQVTGSGVWVKLGTASFTLNASSTIVLNGAAVQDADTTQERPILDAIRLTPVAPPVTVGPYFEAEDYDNASATAAPWAAVADSTASGGTYLAVPEGSTASAIGGAPATGYLDYNFELPSAGPVFIYVFTRETSASNNGSDSLYIDILNDGIAAHEWTAGFTTTNQWVRSEWTTNKPSSLAAGNYTLRIHYREDGFQLDRIAISPTALP